MLSATLFKSIFDFRIFIPNVYALYRLQRILHTHAIGINLLKSIQKKKQANSHYVGAFCDLAPHRAVNRVRLIFRSCGPALAGSTGPLFQNASQNYSVLFWDTAERSVKGSKPNLSALLLHQAHYKKSAHCTHSAIACPTAWKINNSPEN